MQLCTLNYIAMDVCYTIIQIVSSQPPEGMCISALTLSADGYLKIFAPCPLADVVLQSIFLSKRINYRYKLNQC